MAFAHGPRPGPPQQGRNISQEINDALVDIRPLDYDRIIMGPTRRLANVQIFPEPIPIGDRREYITFNNFLQPQIEQFELFGTVDDIKNTDISDTTDKFINAMISFDVKTQNCFKFLKTMMIYQAAIAKWNSEKVANKRGLTDDNLGFMTSYFFAKKNMEYSFNTIYDFLKLPDSSPNIPPLNFSCNTFLLIDLENIIAVCQNQPGSLQGTPRILHDRELMMCIINQWIEITYDGNIIPVFSINNIGVKVKPIQIVRNINGEIICIYIFANTNKGELDDFNISNFCELMRLNNVTINNLEPIFHILSFDAMKWWNIKPQSCYVSINPENDLDLLEINVDMNKGNAGQAYQLPHKKNVYHFFNRIINTMSNSDRFDYSSLKRREIPNVGLLNSTSLKYRHTDANFIFEEKFQVERTINEDKLLFIDVLDGSNTLPTNIAKLIFGHQFDISRVDLDAPDSDGIQNTIMHRADDRGNTLSHFKRRNNQGTISGNHPQGLQPQPPVQPQGRQPQGRQPPHQHQGQGQHQGRRQGWRQGRQHQHHRGGKKKIITSKTKKNRKSKNYIYRNSKKTLKTHKNGKYIKHEKSKKKNTNKKYKITKNKK